MEARWSGLGASARAGSATALALLALAMLSGPAMADPDLVDRHDLLRLAVLELPLSGFLLLLLYLLPNLWHERLRPQPVARHVLLVLGSLASLTLGGALVDVVAFWDGRPGTLQFALGAVGTLLLFTTLAARYLGRSLRAAAIGGGVLALVDLGFWLLLAHMARTGGGEPLLDGMVRLMPVLFFLFLVLLGAETYMFHMGGARPVGIQTAATPIASVPLSRVAEAWGVAMVLAILALAANSALV